MATITTADLIAALNSVADVMERERDALCVLDGVIGDADHGIAMAEGFGAVRKALVELDAKTTPTDVLNTSAKSFLNAVGASSGPLYATAMMQAATAVKGKDVLTDADVPILIGAMAEGIGHRGKAALGDKTMLDAWNPAADAAQNVAGQPAGAVFQAAAKAAEAGAEATKDMQAKLGRAARLGARSVGHVDPGAASAALILRALASSFAQSAISPDYILRQRHP